MALTSINGPASPAPGGYQQAVRNPIYGPGGVIIGSGSTPGANNLPVTNMAYGEGRNYLQQLGLMNRADPYESMAMTEEELRRAALAKLRGQSAGQ